MKSVVVSAVLFILKVFKGLTCILAALIDNGLLVVSTWKPLCPVEYMSSVLLWFILLYVVCMLFVNCPEIVQWWPERFPLRRVNKAVYPSTFRWSHWNLTDQIPDDWFLFFSTYICHLCRSRMYLCWLNDCIYWLNCQTWHREVVNCSSPSFRLIGLLVLVGAGHIVCHRLGPEAVNILFSVCVFPSQESVMLQFCGNKLDKKDFFGKSDPFLVFYRSNEDGS